MEKIIIKKVPLKVQELGNLREILYKELAKSRDVQVFIEKSLYDEIRFNYFDYNMSPETDETTGHYEDYIQNVYEFQDAKNRSEGLIGFVENCQGFMQVTMFKTEWLNYIHYKYGMNRILIICKQNENEKEE